MAGSDELLTELVEDARRVAAYGQRTGRLKDIELISAIATVERLANPNWGDSAVVGMQAALNRAIVDISPVTLGDLRDPRWKPFETRRWYEYGPQLLFVIFALVLLTLTSCATLDFNRGSSLIKEVGEAATRTQRSDINLSIQRLMENAADSETYITTVDHLRDVDNTYRYYQDRSQSYSYLIYSQPYAALARWIGERGYEFLGLMASPDLSFTLTLPSVPQDLCTNQVAPEALPVSSSGHVPNVSARAIKVLCDENLSPALLDGGAFGTIAYSIRIWVDPWGVIYLPALYGALGATIYYIRRFLDPAVRDPSFMRLAVRIASGAFAGVVITWFWTPDSQLLGGFSDAGLTIFTLAFLVGFGVEVLFVLLERLVNGAMMVAKGAEPRPGLIVPFYVGSNPPPPPNNVAEDVVEQEDKDGKNEDQQDILRPAGIAGGPIPARP